MLRLEKIISGFPLRRVGLSLFLLVMIGFGLTVGLRAEVKPTTIGIVSVSDQSAKPYGESATATKVGYDDNFSNWTISKDPSTTAQNFNKTTRLDLGGSFLPVSNATSVRLFKNVMIDISTFSIFETDINVSAGVGYGIRFFSQYANGTQFNVWWEGSALDHRPGSGFESLRLNIQRQAFLATGHNVTRLTRLEIYVEDAPLTSANYELQLLGLNFVNETLAPLESGADIYRATYAPLGNLPYSNSSWYLSKINIGVTLTATADATYTVYLAIFGAIFTSTTSQGLHYLASTSSNEITFYPNRDVPLFPEVLPPWNTSIIFVAGTGIITNFQINYIDLIYLPLQAELSPPSAQSLGFYYTYFTFFLFLLPVGVALAISSGVFRLKPIHRATAAIVLSVGLTCRLALAAVTEHIFDTPIYLTSARAWFQYGNPSGSLGPTLPFTFLLYWMGYSPFALLQEFGFHDIPFLGHPAGLVESIFIKMFPILSDTAVFLFLARFKSDSKTLLWSSFYFLNPLAIFLSGVWGQYEAASIALVVLGLYCLQRNKTARTGVSFVVSGLIELVGFIPYLLLLMTTIWSKKWKTTFVLLSSMILILAYPPETGLIYRLFLAFLGVNPTSSLGSAGKYTLIGSFNLQFISSFHPLIILAAAMFVGVLYAIYSHRFSLNSIILCTGLALLSILLLSGQIASWTWLLPLAILYAIFTGRDSLAAFTLPFGTTVAFLIVSHLTGSAYFLLGNVGYAILPAIEAVRNGLQIYTVTVTFLAALLAYLFLHDNQESPQRTLLVFSGLIFCAYCLAYLFLGVYNA